MYASRSCQSWDVRRIATGARVTTLVTAVGPFHALVLQYRTTAVLPYLW